MLEKIVNTLGPRVGLASLAIKEHQPEIFLAAGIGAGIASTVMLAKAHRKSEAVFEGVLGEIESVNEYVEEHNADATEENERLVRVANADPPQPVTHQRSLITPEEERKLLFPLYLESGKRAVILYGPSVLMGIASIALILASHSSLRRRNRALISTIALIERGFNEYRKRVRDELGEEADDRFYYGAEARSVNTVTVGEDGKKKKKKEKKNHIPEEVSPIMYQRVFDETNQNWSNTGDMNEFFLKATERYSNDRLTIKGWITLNSIYESLGFEASPYGAVVGWSKNVPGDDYISFGIDHDINMREGDTRFVLDFNVNGVILDHIGAR